METPPETPSPSIPLSTKVARAIYDTKANSPYANLLERLAAFLIDTAIVVPLTLAIHLAMWQLFEFYDHPLFYVLLYPPCRWLYTALLESSTRQATVGEAVMGFKIFTEDGRRISFLRATVRWLLGKMVALVVSFGVGFLVMLFTPKRQNLQDLFTKTVCRRDQ